MDQLTEVRILLPQPDGPKRRFLTHGCREAASLLLCPSSFLLAVYPAARQVASITCLFLKGSATRALLTVAHYLLTDYARVFSQCHAAGRVRLGSGHLPQHWRPASNVPASAGAHEAIRNRRGMPRRAAERRGRKGYRWHALVEEDLLITDRRLIVWHRLAACRNGGACTAAEPNT